MLEGDHTLLQKISEATTTESCPRSLQSLYVLFEKQFHGVFHPRVDAVRDNICTRYREALDHEAKRSLRIEQCRRRRSITP